MNDRTQASFDRAQQQYDNVLPPEEDLEREQRRREAEEDEADRQMNEEQTKPVMKDFM